MTTATRKPYHGSSCLMHAHRILEVLPDRTGRFSESRPTGMPLPARDEGPLLWLFGLVILMRFRRLVCSCRKSVPQLKPGDNKPTSGRGVAARIVTLALIPL